MKNIENIQSLSRGGMKMRKLKGICVVLFALSLLGMGQVFAKGSQEVKQEKTIITMWYESGQEEWMNQAVNLFHKSYPNVEIEMTSYSTDNLKQQTKIAAASDTLPDIWWNWGGSLGGYYIENDVCYDLTSIIGELKLDEKFNIASLEAAGKDGKIYGIPRILSTYGIIYHIPTLKEAGWTELPRSFAEFEQMLSDIKSSGKIPLSFASVNGWQMMRLMMYLLDTYCGTETLNQMLDMEIPWNNVGAQTALAKLKEWSDKGYFPEGYISLQPNDSRVLLYSGLAAMTSGSISELRSIGAEYNIEEFGILPFPAQGIDNFTRLSIGSNVLQINAKMTEDKAKLCVEFATCITDPIVAEALADAGNSNAVTIGYGCRNDYSGILLQANLLTEYTNKYGSMVLIDQALTPENASTWFYVQDVVCQGKMTPKEALAYFDTQTTK